MRPFSDIREGDVYKTIIGSEWIVLDKNTEEKMVQVQMLNTSLSDNLNKPFWKKNTDSIFNNRVMLGW